MKIIITGSLGNISKPLTEELVQKGHSVTVISSKPERKSAIETLGAKAAIGSIEDVAFLTSTFTGADVVYSMVPPNNYFDQNLDLLAYYRRIGHNYAQAVQQSGVWHLVNLSSIGAHMDKGNGILLGVHDAEKVLDELPSEIAITHIRPTSFYYNLYGYAEMIKNEGIIAANYGAEDLIPWVSPIDIAAAVAEELLAPPIGRRVRYVASEELSGKETARVLGKAIGKPGLKWLVVTDEQTKNSLVSAGMNPTIAEGLVEMYAALHNGLLAEDYFRNRPVLGKVKMEDFAKEFFQTYNQR